MWPAELQRGILDGIIEGSVTGSQPLKLMVIKTSPMSGTRLVALVTDGGPRVQTADGTRHIMRCILKDLQDVESVGKGSIIEIVHWTPQTVPKSSEQIIMALEARKVGHFADIESINLETTFAKHPLNGQSASQPNASSNGPPQQGGVQQQPAFNASSGDSGGTAPPSTTASNPYSNPNTAGHSMMSAAHTGANFYQSASGDNQSAGSSTWGPMKAAHPAPQQRAAPYGAIVRQTAALCVPITGITTFIAKWQIKARVTAKADMKKYNTARGEGKLFSVDLVDADGGEIRATFFNKGADKYHQMLQPNSVFFFSKGTVRQADKRFNKLNHTCELQFGEDAQIQPADEDDAIPKIKYNFVKISELSDKKKGDFVDVVAVVTRASDISQITIKSTGELKDKRDWVLVDDSNTSIEMTLWGEKTNLIDEATLQTNPVVAIKGAKVDEYQGRKLTASFHTAVDFNPPIPEAQTLKSWYTSGGKDLQTESLSNHITQFPKNEKRHTISAILEAVRGPQASTELEDRGMWFATTAVIHNIDAERNYYWNACPTCNKKVKSASENNSFNFGGGGGDFGADPDDSSSLGGYHCFTCNKDVETPNQKFLLNVEVHDSTGLLKCILIGDHGKALLEAQVEEIEASKLCPSQDGKDFDDYFFLEKTMRVPVEGSSQKRNL
eukprot:Lankesteria_metandrocarpae@DN4352_c0_g1_i2.p1